MGWQGTQVLGEQHWVQILTTLFTNCGYPGKVHSCTCFLSSLMGCQGEGATVSWPAMDGQ